MSRTPKSCVIFAVLFSFVLAISGCGQQVAQSTADSGNTASAATSDAQEITYTLTVDATAANKGMLYDDVVTTKPGTTVYMALIDTGLWLPRPTARQHP